MKNKIYDQVMRRQVNQVKNHLRGHLARKNGENLQSWLEWAFKVKGWDLLRIADGCKKTGRGARDLIPQKQAFDYEAFGPDRRVIYFDAKHRSASKYIQPSMFKPPKDPKAAATLKNQLDWLKRIKNRGHEAGFIVYLPAVDQVHFVDIDNVTTGESKIIGSFARGLYNL